MTRPISNKQQQIQTRHIIESAAMDADARVNRDPGAKVSEFVGLLDELLDDASYQAFRQELSGLVIVERLKVCKKWMSFLLLVDAAEARKRALPGNPGGMACYKFHQAVEDARACGWTIVTLPYSHRVEMIYWNGAA